MRNQEEEWGLLRITLGTRLLPLAHCVTWPEGWRVLKRGEGTHGQNMVWYISAGNELEFWLLL